MSTKALDLITFYFFACISRERYEDLLTVDRRALLLRVLFNIAWYLESPL